MSETCGCGCKHSVAGAAGVTGSALTPDATVGAAVKRSPRALAVLRELGIDTCCGGGLTLAQAAATAGTSTERLLRALGEPAEK